ncbi:MAG: AAA family ATPase [bacterium]|nr:AAA family ATPase [bacterium]
MRHVRVQGFKSLVDVTLDLGVLNVFIGANGSGKSNLLEALGVLGAGAFGSVEPETLRYRGVRLGLPKLYKSSFSDLKIRRLITLEAGDPEGPFYRLGLDNPIDQPFVKWKIASENLQESPGKSLITRSRRACKLHRRSGSDNIDISDSETAARFGVIARPELTAAAGLVDALGKYAIYSPSTPVLRGLEKDVARPPLGLGGSQLPECVRSLVKPRSETFGTVDLDDLWELIDWAEDLAVVPPDRAGLAPGVMSSPLVMRFRDRFMRDQRNTLSAYDASEGALYVLFALALITHSETPRLLALDNFDQTLHPRLAAALTRLVSETLVKQGSRQLLMTTHNPLVLDGLDLSDDRVRLFAVDRGRGGPTRVRRVQLSPELLDMARKERLSLSRLWVMGRIGGVPEGIEPRREGDLIQTSD